MTQKKQSLLSWFILFLLGAVWGSSFILMKIGSKSLGSVEIAALRNGIAGAFVLPFFLRSIKNYSKKNWTFLILCALLGNGIPSIFYAYSSKYIDSNINGVINSLTPIFTLLIGVYFLKIKISKWSVLGVFIGFMGVFILFFSKGFSSKNLWIVFLPLVSTAMYGTNTNLIKEKLSHLSSFQMLTGIFGVMAIPAMIYLVYAQIWHYIHWEYFSFKIWQTPINEMQKEMFSFSAIFLLGFMNSFLSSLLFYYFLRRTSAIFASMTTYLIPIMSIFWGFMDGEYIGWFHAMSLSLILLGVFMVSKRK
jgi:drug/metabolite transporter (DMT)-like permease